MAGQGSVLETLLVVTQKLAGFGDVQVSFDQAAVERTGELVWRMRVAPTDERIVVCGHSHCGGIRALYEGAPEQATNLKAWLELGREAVAGRALPYLGICLGHQLLGVASGHETFKLPFGHRGSNHPVLERASGHDEGGHAHAIGALIRHGPNLPTDTKGKKMPARRGIAPHAPHGVNAR